MAGRTVDVTIITCSINLVNESSGLKAHKTLVPANARYARRQMMWGGKVSLPTRELFRTAKIMKITTNAGQKILFSGRGVIMACSLAIADVPAAGGFGITTLNNGDTIIT
jgi:hypothetical protein